jgi:N-methylhydantoinase B
MRVQINPPGGGGYGRPHERPAEQVLSDVVSGYVSIDAAEREYGVVVRYLGTAGQLVRLPEHYAIDWDATRARRG